MAKYNAGQLNDFAKSLLFADKATKRLEARMPILNAIRGQLIINNGMFATVGDNGSPVAGYAYFGWSTPDRKTLAKAIVKAQLIPVAIPQGRENDSWAEGYVIAFADGDAAQFGCDVNSYNEHVGVMGITADALATVLTGKSPVLPQSEREQRPLTAIALADGLASLRAGETITVEAFVSKTNPANNRPQMDNVPAFPQGVQFHAGQAAPAVEEDASPFAFMANTIKVGDVPAAPAAPARSGYGMASFRGRNRGR